MSTKKAAKRASKAAAANTGGVAPIARGGATQTGAAQREAQRVAAVKAQVEREAAMARIRAVDDAPMPLPEVQLPEFPSWFGPTVRFLLMLLIIVGSYKIRLFAVHNYGKVIHEFDPWFNYRATEYMSEHGYEKFSKWFDTKVWHPIGRPVGTTTYPGMMLTSATLHKALNALGYEISLNDVCVFIPAWFSCLTCLFTLGLAYEAFRSPNAAVGAAGIMAIIPAHLMRSVAGGYDNESVAVAAIVGTFFFWCRSLRHDSSWPLGVLTGFSYIYMAAAWGGFTFVLNMIGVHAGVLILTGNYTPKLHRAYTLFFLIGTAGAMQVPVIGWQPLQSLEQLGPLGIFAVLQLLAVADIFAAIFKLSKSARVQLQFAMLAAGAAILAAVLFGAMEAGYLGPVSARVRGLFIKHTKTGNPLVDSVAEHQATPTRAYWRYFHVVMYLTPVGLASVVTKKEPRTDAEIFLVLYTLISWYFSQKMIRLILLLGPAASCMGGKALCVIVGWSLKQLQKGSSGEGQDEEARQKAERRNRLLNERRVAEMEGDTRRATELAMQIEDDDDVPAEIKWGFAVLMLVLTCISGQAYLWHCRRMAEGLSEPQIMTRIRDPDTNEIVIVDDYREAYGFLREQTPEDSRVLAWWDYGYQITGVGNRTTIADGNTWNHEHIALLGRALVLPEEEGYEITRHLADYVLVVTTRHAGMYGDDLAKSPHMARIAGSVYSDINATGFTMERDGSEMGAPSAMMKNSLLYRLHSYGMADDVTNLTHYEEAYTSPRKMVRIYKILGVDEESKTFSAEHIERCKTEDGGWNGKSGQYPPALDNVLEKGKSFQQLEDFNNKNKK